MPKRGLPWRSQYQVYLWKGEPHIFHVNYQRLTERIVIFSSCQTISQNDGGFCSSKYESKNYSSNYRVTNNSKIWCSFCYLFRPRAAVREQGIFGDVSFFWESPKQELHPVIRDRVVWLSASTALPYQC
jgi:hypothetical protein